MIDNKYKYESLLEKDLNKRNIVIKYENIASLTKEEFAYARNNGFGASDSSTLLEVNPWNKRMDLINSKANNEINEEISKKASVRTGSDLEPLILDKAENLLKTCLYLDDNNDIVVYKPIHMYGSKETPLNVNYDGVLFVNENIITVVEAKLVTKYGQKYYNFDRAFLKTVNGNPDISYKNDIEKPDTPVLNNRNFEDVCTGLADYYGIPIYYFTQVQQQLASLDADFGYLVAQNQDKWETYIFKIYKHNDIIDRIKEESIKAWAMVEAKRASKNR